MHEPFIPRTAPSNGPEREERREFRLEYNAIYVLNRHFQDSLNKIQFFSLSYELSKELSCFQLKSNY